MRIGVLGYDSFITQAVNHGTLGDIILHMVGEDRPTTISIPRCDTPSADLEPLPAGLSVGRYMLVKQVGLGGVGVVYAAYDQDLDRRVALKILQRSRGSGTEQAQARMVREAQALARLAHPNVVAVHEVGCWRERPFVVMEFVEGLTLSKWRRAAPRSWRETVRMCIQAGRGLAAAHDRGIVHRDFKPANVLIGTDGRARVVDFGLAKGVGEIEPGSTESFPSSDVLSDHLTHTGVTAGTPPYMAPEQFRGEAPDPRTDQYSFCISLWEVLYGERPFQGRSRAELETNVHTASLPDPPRGEVPAFVQRVLRRGLSKDPNARFPSMDELLRALDRDPSRARRRTAAMGAGMVLVGTLSAGAATWSGAEPDDPCDGGPDRLGSAWDEAREQSVRASFGRVDAEFAVKSLETITVLLDDYERRWLTQYRDACEATRVEHEQSPELLELRMACLDRRQSALDVTTSLLAEAERDAVARSVPAVLAIPDPDDCDRARSLLAQGTIRAEAGHAEEEEARQLRADLDRAQALGTTGRADDGLALAQGVHDRATELEHRPLRAEASLVVGVLAASAGEPHLAQEQLEAAVEDAIASGHDEILAAATVRLIHQVGIGMSHYDEAERWARLGRAAVQRLGQDSEEALELEANTCSMLQDKGDWAAALPHCNQHLTLALERHGPEHPETARANRLLGQAYGDAGDHETADRLARRAFELFRASHGSDHPEYPIMLSAVAVACYYQGRGEACIPMFEQTVEAVERVSGPEHPALADASNNLAILLVDHGRLDPAEQHARRALAIRRAGFGDDHPGVGASHRILARIALERGEHSKGLEHAHRAVRISSATRGGDHPDVLESLQTRASLLDALELEAEAIADRRRALAMATHLNRPPEQRAALAFELAKDLADHDPDALEEALQLARQAREDARDGRDSSVAEPIEAWLRQHDDGLGTVAPADVTNAP